MNLSKNMLVIAHRGASAVAPENTLAAFARAVAEGADMIELDCRLTKDGHVVVIHDASVDRTTDGSGNVSAMTLAEIRRLDAGSWFDPAFRGERIPTLSEALLLMRGRCQVNIEIKSSNFPVSGIERAGGAEKGSGIEEKIYRELEACRFPLEDVLISSFNHAHLAAFRRIDPALRLAALFDRMPPNLSDVPADVLHPAWRVVTEDLVETAHASGRRVNVWTVDSEADWRRAIELEVDGVITNVPGRLRAFLGDNDPAS